MNYIWWSLGCLCAAFSGLSVTHEHFGFFTVYFGFLAIGTWLEGVAYVIKDKRT